MGCHAAQFVVEAFHNREDLAAKRHVAADEVAYRASLLREAAIAAPHDPVELFGEPVGALACPCGQHIAAYSQYARMLVATCHLR